MNKDSKLVTRSLTPAKSGSIYGKFHPSPAKKVRVMDSIGVVKVMRLNRKERRHGQYS